MRRKTQILSMLGTALVAFPSFTGTPDQAQARRAAEVSAEQLASRLGELGLDGQHGFILTNHIGDELSLVHTRFQQTYGGVKVWGGEAITHLSADGREWPMTDALMRNIHINTSPSLEPREALAVAHAALAPKGGYAEEPSVELVIYPHSVNLLAARARSKHAADIDATDLERQVTRYILAYHVHTLLLNGTEETRSQDYLINAHTGEILKGWDTLQTAAANGTGKSQWYGTVPLNTNSTASGFELRDMTRGAGGTFGNNVTTDLGKGTTGNGTVYTDADNAWGDGLAFAGTTTSANGQTAAVDGHRGLQATWDFYKNVFVRNGIDNTGKATYNRMHYSSNYDNAFWQDTCFCMTYGDGAPPNGSYGEADLDTAGHEMTHGVCATTANLTYSGESGGLNESNSDIFGTCVEFYVLGAGGTGSVVPDYPGSGPVTANYTMFENSWGHPGQALRYMYKPSLDGSSPDAWSSSLGGLDVHYSSGPMNRCFYFMARGATTSGDTSTAYLPSGMAGIGNDKAAHIWYRTLTTKLTSGSNYAAARAGAIASAQELYGAGSAAEQAVWNAFHGINVGAAWSGSTPAAPAITTQPASKTVPAGGTATFTVTATGSAPLAYQWRKNGTSITGATAASYTTPAATTADNGSSFSVVVSNSAGSATSDHATLTVTAPPPGSAEVEPNNTQAAAQNIATSGTTLNGTLASSTDIDYYKCTLGAGRTITATLAPNSASDYDLYLYNSNGTLIASSTKGTGAVDTVSVKNTGTSAFTRYVKVIYYAGRTGSTGTYTLRLTF